MKQILKLDALRREITAGPRPFGLVPTMGFLHPGHLALVRRARAECRSVGVSIFVNPAQFGPKEDFSAYPRDLARDLRLLESAGADLVWTPAEEEVYPPGFDTIVEVGQPAHPLEGAARPGHFRGVATVVAKLFNAFTPDRVYFGQKDAQQVAVIRRMSADLNFPLEIIVCPTVREADGLAMSSRNTYLNPQERLAATVLYRSLSTAKDLAAGGERNADTLRLAMRGVLAAEPLAEPEYVSIADPDSLQEIETLENTALFSMAVRIGRTRLIDNFLLRDGMWETGEKMPS